MVSQALRAQVINLSHPRVKVFTVRLKPEPVEPGLVMKSDTVPVVGLLLLSPVRTSVESLVSGFKKKMLH